MTEPRAALPPTAPVPSPPAVPAGLHAPNWTRWARVALLVLADGAAILVAATVAYLVWARLVRHQRPDVYLELLPLLPAFFLANANVGLYPGFGLGAVETLRRLTLATSSVFVSLAAVAFAIKLAPVYSRMTFALAWAGAVVLLPVTRYLLLVAAHRWRWWGEPCIVVGGGELARRTVAALRRSLSLGYVPRAIVAAWAAPRRQDLYGLPVLGDLETLREGARGTRVVLVAEEEIGNPAALVGELRQRFRHVLWIREHTDLPVEGLEVRNLGGVFGVQFADRLHSRRNRAVKRGSDLVLGATALVLALPVLLASAAAIRLTSPGAVLFRQRREGRSGRPFELLKLRTMYVDADDRLARHLASSPEARAEWERRVKLADDPRVVPAVGRWLRRFSLDELPQLLNVLAGQMSLVGPRPFPEYHLQRFSEGFRALRRRVRPGLTGLWQVMVRSEGGVAEQEAYDAYYIRNWSLWMDLYILGKTLAAVLRGRGAF
jgi:Undecaprenyl-phosphate galactose phosphotransferase WbaP